MTTEQTTTGLRLLRCPQPPKVMYPWYEIWRDSSSEYVIGFCPLSFEKFLPPDLHLPPGGGPVLIEVTIRKAGE